MFFYHFYLFENQQNHNPKIKTIPENILYMWSNFLWKTTLKCLPNCNTMIRYSKHHFHGFFHVIEDMKIMKQPIFICRTIPIKCTTVSSAFRLSNPKKLCSMNNSLSHSNVTVSHLLSLYHIFGSPAHRNSFGSVSATRMHTNMRLLIWTRSSFFLFSKMCLYINFQFSLKNLPVGEKVREINIWVLQSDLAIRNITQYNKTVCMHPFQWYSFWWRCCMFMCVEYRMNSTHDSSQ